MTIFASIHDLQLITGNFSTVLLLSPDEPLMSGIPEDILRPAILEKTFNCPPRRHPLLLDHMQSHSKKVG
jgi:ABC-type cobalamin/Fe3+-siderophores transport system ATPase subunit